MPDAPALPWMCIPESARERPPALRHEPAEDSRGASLPLRIAYTEPAEAELSEAYVWLQTFGPEVAGKWLTGLVEALENEAALLAAVPLRRQRAPDAPPG